MACVDLGGCSAPPRPALPKSRRLRVSVPRPGAERRTRGRGRAPLPRRALAASCSRRRHHRSAKPHMAAEAMQFCGSMILRGRPVSGPWAERSLRASMAQSRRHRGTRTRSPTAILGENLVRAALALDPPAQTQQRSEHALGASARPGTHAALNEMSSRSGPASPCSRRSATTRSASAWILALASAEVCP